MNSVISFEKVSKTYAKQLGELSKIALADVSFSLGQGETLGMIGANGAGKSTCIKLLMDFIRPDTGHITVLEKSPQKHAIRSRIGYLPETANFPSNLTVLDMLRFTGKAGNLTRANIHTASEKWLRRLDLWDDRKRPLRNYSKGMQQRANFAIALLGEPELLILDEPMSGLDPIGRADILSLIGELKNQGRAILFCSHILEDVDRLADRVLVLHKGQKFFEGQSDALAKQQGCPTFVEGYLSLVEQVQK
ncbi:MAG: ABC transporter ATP-binding protein [Desulfurivibrionaceae bacterium]|jgi:ABC-2 type transport system ATP-binding protein|nr:ABC transporter ATP-binding protein [Pseudomonadota bacterium]MBU4408452.1 ABC transporter ATP-binding protein [Pseudomonadota bacterium]MBU4413448.1 ABC transporter ATP-binding protein [Pseudomonadota bacterium]MCG2824929.1 ABC transporter ATP-binding protein [Desulfobulbaceae bacterium]MDP2758770.1 ABC transporter ATP-binding protein [Desulfurivibrionaceae bacterium]